MSREPEWQEQAAGPVTATVTRRVKPGHEAAYEEFLAGIGGAARAFPGYLGEEVFRPAGGPGGEYRIVYRFDSPAHLRAWLDSGARGVVGARRAACRRADAHPVPDRAGELVHPARPARRAATAALQDGHPHLGDDLPADHPGRPRLGAAHRALAAGSPARSDDAGDRVGDDLGGHAAGDPAAAPVAVSRP